MKKFFIRTTLALLIMAIILLILVAFFALNDWGLTFAVKQVVPVIEEKTGYRVDVEKVRGAIPNTLTFKNLRVINTVYNDTLLTADRLTVKYPFNKLLKGQLIVHSVALEKPFIRVRQNEDGQLNWIVPAEPKPEAAPDTSQSTFSLSLERIEIIDGAVDVGFAGVPVKQVRDLNLTTAVRIRPEGQFINDVRLAFDLPEANVQLHELRGRIAVVDNAVKLDSLALQTTHSELRTDGRLLLDPFAFDLEVISDSLRVEEFAYFLPDSLDVTGQLALNAWLNGPPDSTLHVDGTIDIARLQYDRYQARDATIDLLFADEILEIQDMYGVVNDLYFSGVATLNLNPGKHPAYGDNLPAYDGQIRFSRLDPEQFIPPGTTTLQLDGNIAGDVTFDGTGFDPQQMNVRAELNLEPTSTLHDVPLTQFDADVQWVDEALIVHAFEARSDTARLVMNGRLTPQTVDAEVSISKVDLYHFRSWLEGHKVAGSLDFNGRVNGALDDPSIFGAVRLKEAFFDSMTAREISGQVRVEKVMSTRRGDSRLTCFDLDIQQQKIDKIYLGAVADGPLVTVDTLYATVGDSINASLQAQLRLAENEVAIHVGSLEFITPIFTLNNPDTLNLTVSAEKLRLADFDLTSTIGDLSLYGDYVYDKGIDISGQLFDISLENVGKLASLPVPVSGWLNANLSVNGPLSDLTIFTSLNIAEMMLKDFPLGDLNSTIVYADNKLAVPTFDLLNENRLLTANGYIPLNLSDEPMDSTLVAEGMRFTVEIEDQPMALVNLFMPPDKTFSGTWDAFLIANGPLDDPVINGDFAIRDAAFADSSSGLHLSEIQSSLTLDQEIVSVDSLSVRFGQESWLKLRGTIETTVMDFVMSSSETEDAAQAIPIASWDLRLNTKNFNLQDITLAAFEELGVQPTGELKTSMRLTGSPYQPDFRLETHVDELGIRGKSAGTAKMVMRYDGQQAVLDSLSLFYRDRRRVHATARIPLEIRSILAGDSLQIQDISAHLETYYADLWMFTFMSPDVFVERGYVTSGFEVSGDLADPTIEGTFGLESGFISLPATGTILAQTMLEGEVTRDTIFVNTLTADTNEQGKLKAHGWAAMGEFDFPNTNLTVTARNFRFENISDVSGTVDADLTITGPAQRVLCAGDVRLKEGLLTMPFEEDESATTTSSGSGTSTQMIWEFPLDLDLKITGPSIWLRNQQTDIEMKIDLDIWTRKNLLYIAGNVNVLRGIYYMYDYSFEVVEGEFRFLGTSTIDPQIKIVAETRLRVTESEDRQNVPVLLQMQITGTFMSLNQPTFKAYDPQTMEPRGYSESDALLALSIGYTQNGLSTLNRNAKQKALSRFSGMMVNQQLTRRLRNSTELFDTLDLDTNLFGGESSSATVTIGKYLSEDLFVSYSQGLPFRHGNRVRVEYSLNRWATVVGEREATTEEEKDQSENYTIDLKLKYRF